jgi:hypothetical protein
MANRDYIKKELKRLFRSMDFISKRFLSDEKACGKDFQIIILPKNWTVVFSG